MPSLTITLTMNEKQARVLERALDLHTRLGLGQVREVAEYLPAGYTSDGAMLPTIPDRDKILDHLLAVVRELGFNGFGHSYGVGHRSCPPDSMISYDLGAVMRNTIHSLREDPDAHWSTWSNPPLHCGSEPLAKAEVVKAEGE